MSHEAEKRLAETGLYVKTKSGLAREVGFTHQYLNALEKKHEEKIPKTAKGYNIAECFDWIQQRQPDNKRKGHGDEYKQLQAEKLRKQVELLEVRVQREKNQVIDIDEVDGLMMRQAAAFKSRLYEIEDRLSTRLEGLSSADIRHAIREQCDKICKQMSREKYTTKNANTQPDED